MQKQKTPEEKDYSGAPAAHSPGACAMQGRSHVPFVGEKGTRLTESGRIGGKGDTKGTF